MAKNNTKMFTVVILSCLILVSIIGLEFVYFNYVDKKVVARALGEAKILNVAGAESRGVKLRDISNDLKLEYALNTKDRADGLMYRESLCDNCGMFFIFENVQPLSFWMKNVQIPLDIIFISAEGKVTNIEKASAEPNSKDDSQYITYNSNEDALYVLETNQNWAEKNQLKAGDYIDLKKILPKN